MERSRAVLITLVYGLFSRISGAEVEMRVRPGDNVILYSDCVLQMIGETVWFRNSSNELQPPHMISLGYLVQGAFSRHAFVWNHSNQTQDLLVKNVTESDLGLYYCARQDTKQSGGGVLEEVYYFGNRTTRLSMLGEKNDHEQENRNEEDQKRTTYDEVGGDDIIYAPLDVMSRGQKRVKKERVQRSDLCTYSETGVSGLVKEEKLIQDLMISGAEVEMRVRPGDNVVLYSDCVSKIGTVVWFRNSSNEHQSHLIFSGDTLTQAAFSRYSFVWNPSNKTLDLLVKNITDSDLGLYYCAIHVIKFLKDVTVSDVRTDVYLYGNRTTRLSLHVEKDDKKKSERAQRQKCRRSDEVEEGGVCYASLDHQSRGQKRLKKKKKKRVEISDFSTYSEVKTDQIHICTTQVFNFDSPDVPTLKSPNMLHFTTAIHATAAAGLLYPPTGHSMHNSAPYLSWCKRASYNSQHEVLCPLVPTAVEVAVIFMAALHHLQAAPPATNNVTMRNGTPHVACLHSSWACKHGHHSSSAFTTLLS
ncbi:hypothetical protein MHYP_G00250310 [Metynnis hypsauchen]